MKNIPGININKIILHCKKCKGILNDEFDGNEEDWKQGKKELCHYRCSKCKTEYEITIKEKTQEE